METVSVRVCMRDSASVMKQCVRINCRLSSVHVSYEFCRRACAGNARANANVHSYMTVRHVCECHAYFVPARMHASQSFSVLCNKMGGK